VEDQSIIDDLNVDGSGASALFKDTERQVGNDILVTHVGNAVITNFGLVTVQARDQSPTSTNARKLIINNLDMGTPSPPVGTLDLKDNVLIIDYSGSSPIDDIDLLITSGYNGGAWTGTGIQSSTAAGTVNDTHKTAVGFAENVTGGSDGLNLNEFEGQSVDDSKY
jgi:hypothetical protein